VITGAAVRYRTDDRVGTTISAAQVCCLLLRLELADEGAQATARPGLVAGSAWPLAGPLVLFACGLAE
jgi:hypothetical protein